VAFCSPLLFTIGRAALKTASSENTQQKHYKEPDYDKRNIERVYAKYHMVALTLLVLQQKTRE